ncbi:MAG TPA: S-methyl-5-thioribose-1-phosphate isomerase [Tepidisphaeraceae bacterium]|jgi:methylthioribose-1-phosphate isomerase|nr:S-methyl-5-thioribose-1-phosphate isomerase [Tepidisphaeraceae bacterium]
MLQTITWTGKAARLLDQTRLPTETLYVDITDEKQMWDAIKRLVVRGAPAIGVAAAFGVYLGVRNWPELTGFAERLDEVCDYLATSRPTAVNLFWAIERIRRHAKTHPIYRATPVKLLKILKQRILDEALLMLEEDNRVCKAIGEYGAKLLKKHKSKGKAGQINVLTHCNAGGLATVMYGTALAPVYVGAGKGLKFHVYSDETRPLLQGSRITAYELKENGIPVTVICDNMAATVMHEGKVSAVIVGTDRVAANGDVANKIGTLGVAILARYYKIPFYVAAPTSSIDLSLATGAEIPIEQRDAKEITAGLGKITAPAGVEVYNPAFDVTPAELVTAIITENGVAEAPYGKSLKRLCEASVVR